MSKQQTLKKGNYVIINKVARARNGHHGRIVSVHYYAMNDTKIVGILFPNGATSTWYAEDCTAITKQKYFKLLLS